MVLLPLLALAVAAPIPRNTPDDRVRATFGRPADPVGDCRFEPLDGGGLTVRVPGGDRTLDADNKKAPTATREVDGNFTVEVAVAIKFDPDSAPAGQQGVGVAGGLVLLGPDDLVITLGYKHLRPGGNVNGAWCSPSEYSARGPGFDVGSLGAQPFTPDKPMHLRLTRTGNRLAADWSADGKVWKRENGGLEAVALPDKVQVGVFATQQTGKPAAVTFTGYQLTTALPLPK